MGRARSHLREILTSGRSKIQELIPSIERLEDLFRRYCARRDEEGIHHTLVQDMRMAALEALIPEDLEKHVQLNRSRLKNYDELRREVILYAEARCGSKTFIQSPSQPSTLHNDPMDVGVWGVWGGGKGGKKGKHSKGSDGGKNGKGGKTGKRSRSKVHGYMFLLQQGGPSGLRV